MSRLLPFKSETAPSPDDPQVLDLGDEATEDALSALSSETARTILAAVYDEPKTPPEIRDEVGTSLQNVHYHVDNLEEADLIEPAGTGYSEKGTEMTVYAPANEAVVLFAGQEHDRSRLQTALTRLLGAVGLLAVASLAVRRLVEMFGGDPTEVGDPGGPGDGAAPAATATAEPDRGAGTAAPDGTPIPETDTSILADGETPAEEIPDTPAPTSADTPAAGDTPTVQSESPVATPEPTPTPGQTATPPPEGTPSPPGTATPEPVATQTPAPSPSATESATSTPTPTPTDVPSMGPETTAALQNAGANVSDGLLADPGVAFFLGGAFMLGVAATWWYLST